MGTLRIVTGDITRLGVDAIVNAANSGLLGGGGVDGAIHRAAGPQLLEFNRTLGGCPTGEARLTPGFDLQAKHVIHTVGPVYESAAVSGPLLRKAHASCLALANDTRVASIAFPAISCGAYGYPLDEAARIAVETCRTHAGVLAEIRFVLFGTDAYVAWLEAARLLSA